MGPLQWGRYNGAVTMGPLQWGRYNGAVRLGLGSSDFTDVYYTIYRRIQLQLTALLSNMKAVKQ